VIKTADSEDERRGRRIWEGGGKKKEEGRKKKEERKRERKERKDRVRNDEFAVGKTRNARRGV